MVKNPRTGFWGIKVPTKNGRSRTVCTGHSVLADAHKAIRDSGVDQVIALSKMKALTAKTLSIVTSGRRFDVQDAIKKWQADIRVRVSPSTANVYAQQISLLLKLFGLEKEALASITRDQLDTFVNAGHFKRNTRTVRLATVKSFYTFCSDEGLMLGNPSARIIVKPHEQVVEMEIATPAVPVTEEEYQRIVAGTQGFWRWATILGWWLGYRISDVATLQLASLQGDKMIIFPKKTGRQLELPLSNPLIGSPELLATLQEIQAQARHAVYCFPGERAIAMDDTIRSNLSVKYTRILRRLGIQGKSFHSLRHSFKLRMDAAGVPVVQTQGWMGHRFAATTEGYGRVVTAPPSSSTPPSSGEAPPQ